MTLKELFQKNIQAWIVKEEYNHLQAMLDLGMDFNESIPESDELKRSLSSPPVNLSFHMSRPTPLSLAIEGTPFSEKMIVFLLNAGASWISPTQFNLFNLFFKEENAANRLRSLVENPFLKREPLLKTRKMIEGGTDEEGIKLSCMNFIFFFSDLEQYTLYRKDMLALIDVKLENLNLNEKLPANDIQAKSKKKMI